MLQPGGDQHGAEHDEGEQGEDLPFRLHELEDEGAIGLQRVAQGQAPHKGGDEAVAAQPFRQGKADQRAGQHGDAPGRVGHAAAGNGKVKQPRQQITHGDADQRAQRELQGHETVEVVGRAMNAGLGDLRRDNGGQHDHRHRQAVVEAALHIDRLPHPCGQRVAGKHGLGQGGIGGRQQGGQQHRQHHRRVGRHPMGDQRAQRDGQRHADQQHAGGNGGAVPQAAQVHAGRIGEQHQHQGDFGKAMQQRVADAGVQQVEAAVPQGEAEPHEQHGQGHRGLTEAPRHQRPGHDADADQHNLRRCVHGGPWELTPVAGTRAGPPLFHRSIPPRRPNKSRPGEGAACGVATPALPGMTFQA